MKVLYPNVLVKLDDKPEEVNKVLIINTESLDIPTSGVVVDAPDKSEYSIGDRVTVDPFAGHSVDIENSKHLVVNEMDIHGEII